MSRLMDDLNKLNESRKVDGGIIVQDAEELKMTPVASSHKSVYFIGFLIVLIVALSAFSTRVSLKTLSRVEDVEDITASTSARILARLEDSEDISASLLETLKKQDGETRDLQALMTQQSEEELARVDDLKGQLKDLRIVLREKEHEIEEMIIARNSLKSLLEDSVDDLKIADRLMRQKYVELSDKVKKIVDTNAYIYSTY